LRLCTTHHAKLLAYRAKSLSCIDIGWYASVKLVSTQYHRGTMMGIFIRNFRLWWQPPRDIRNRPEQRQVTFLELFYDLVYVVLIAEITGSLAENITAQALTEFVFMFILVWWAWVNGTMYHEVHGNNDIRTRVFTFLQIFTVAAMAVFAGGAFTDTGAEFALATVAYQLILTYMWWRSGVYDPNHRPLSRPYVVVFLISTALFFTSAFTDPATRSTLWMISVGMSVILPFLSLLRFTDDPDIIEQMALSRHPTPALVERFGLLTIIVLGEVMVGTVQGIAAYENVTLEIFVIGGLGMAIAIGIWWIYFDFISHRLPYDTAPTVLIWMYSHLPITAGIAAIGAATLNVMGHATDALPLEVRWLFVDAIGLVLISNALVITVLNVSEEHRLVARKGQIVMAISGVLILLLGMTSLDIIPLLLAIVALMLAPVIAGLYAWIWMTTHAHEQESELADVDVDELAVNPTTS